MTRVERDVRFLKGYAICSTLVMAVLLLTAFTRQSAPAEMIQAQRARFSEIDVERINVIEPGGTYRMVLANRPKSPSPMRKGKAFIHSAGTRPGLIFYDDEGSENGGLIFGGKENEDGTHSAFHHMSFDQFHQNQIMVLQYNDQNGRRHVGMRILDRHNEDFYAWTLRRDSLRQLPDSPAKTEALRRMEEGTPDDPRVAERVYVGRDYDKNAVVSLRDRLGKLRIRMIVDSLGSARLEFLDSAGQVTHRIPDSAQR